MKNLEKEQKVEKTNFTKHFSINVRTPKKKLTSDDKTIMNIYAIEGSKSKHGGKCVLIGSQRETSNGG